MVVSEWSTACMYAVARLRLGMRSAVKLTDLLGSFHDYLLNRAFHLRR